MARLTASPLIASSQCMPASGGTTDDGTLAWRNWCRTAAIRCHLCRGVDGRAPSNLWPLDFTGSSATLTNSGTTRAVSAVAEVPAAGSAARPARTARAGPAFREPRRRGDRM